MGTTKYYIFIAYMALASIIIGASTLVIHICSNSNEVSNNTTISTNTDTLACIANGFNINTNGKLFATNGIKLTRFTPYVVVRNNNYEVVDTLFGQFSDHSAMIRVQNHCVYFADTQLQFPNDYFLESNCNRDTITITW